jgi:hypothetical protein
MKYVKHARLIIIVAVLALVAIIYVSPVSPEYQANLVTEFIGVLVTVLLVDQLYQYKAESEKRSVENIKIKNMHNLVSIYIDGLTFSVLDMTNPFGNLENEVITKIKLSDFQHMYKPQRLRLAPNFEKAYQPYFSNVAGLCETFKHHLPHIDVQQHAELVTLMQEFVKLNESDRLFKAIEERPNTTLGGKEKAHEFDIGILKEHTGDVKYPAHSNAIDIYVRLHETIQHNYALIVKYLDYLKKAGIT